MLEGFKEFIGRGNAVDLAVGVVIGAAFTGVVDALVGQVISPLIGALFGQPDFDSVGQFQIALFGDPAVIRPGTVVTALFNFLVVAIALYFFVVLPLNKLAEARAAKEGLEDDVAPEIQLLTEIRDTLQAPVDGTHAKE